MKINPVKKQSKLLGEPVQVDFEILRHCVLLKMIDILNGLKRYFD